MKKLIYIILASSLLISCSSNSSNNDANNTGLLIKSMKLNNDNPTLYNYYGSKLSNILYFDGSTSTFTYSGDLIIKEQNNGTNGSNYVYTYNYLNDVLNSSTSNIFAAPSTNYNYVHTYTYNSDGSLTATVTGTYSNSGNTQSSNSKHILYFSQGNCVKIENYNSSNILTGSSTYTYDTKNNPYKNVTGYYSLHAFNGFSINNQITETHKNAQGVTDVIYQTSYQYNSQNFPISNTTTSTNYSINPQTGVLTPGTQYTDIITYTYY